MAVWFGFPGFGLVWFGLKLIILECSTQTKKVWQMTKKCFNLDPPKNTFALLEGSAPYGGLLLAEWLSGRLVWFSWVWFGLVWFEAYYSGVLNSDTKRSGK